MTQKRQTLDSLGTRLRARTYGDSYVPKPVCAGLVYDTVVRRKSTNTGIMHHTETLAIKKAKSILHVGASIQTGQTIAVPAVQKIHSVNTVVRPVFDKQANALEPKLQNTVQVPKTNPSAISHIVKDIQSEADSRSDRPAQYIGRSRGLVSIARERLSHFAEKIFATKRSIATMAMSIILFAGGSVALVSSFTTNQSIGIQVQALSEKVDAEASISESLGATDSNNSVPSEEKVPEAVVNSYKPPADEPRYISIPKIKNAKTRVLKMGVGKDGAVQTPRTTWDTGWFGDSSKPGDKVGAALIVGHVSGLTTGGVFYNLYRLTIGDEIIVETGDGTFYTYKVVAKEEVPADSINKNNYLVSKNVDKPGLTLMTCAGEFNPVTQTYENRLAVFAVRTN